jgi:large subunit ribosomal protein L25
MLQVDVDARVRSNFGKGAARSMRRAGLTPAILYGQGTDPIALELDTRVITKTLMHLQRRNAVVTLDVEGGDASGKRHVLVKDLQVDPIQDTLIHADFYEIAIDEPTVFSVPIHYTGKAVGVELGGELSTPVTAIDMKGKPLDIPDYLELDITELKLGDKLTCNDLEVPANITLLNDLDTVCVSVVTATLLPLEEEEEEGEAAETEEAPAEGEEAPTEE